MKMIDYLHSFGIFLLLVLCSCNVADEMNRKISSNSKNNETGNQSILTSTSIYKSTLSKPVDILPIPLQTITQTKFQAEYPTETWLPPLILSEAEEKAIQLLRDNGGCKLPCFWNIKPQQFNKQSISPYFQTFHNIGGDIIHITKDNVTTEVFLNWEYSGKNNSEFKYIDVRMKAFRVIEIENEQTKQDVFDNPSFIQQTQYYSLSNILSIYGKPDNVFIGIEPGAEWGFNDIYCLLLDYSKNGWISLYYMELEQKNDIFIGCTEHSQIELQLWRPEDVSFATQRLSDIKKTGNYVPIEEATTLSLDEFFQRFKKAGNHICLETPMSLFTGEY